MPVPRILIRRRSRVYGTVLSQEHAPRLRRAIIQNEIIHIDIELCAALTRLRSCTEDLVFWIADVCIDQSNPQERSQQVTRIGDIYRNARELFIWLGWERSTEAFSLLADFYEHREDHDWLKSKIRDRKYSRSLLRFGDLLRHGYWFRIWAIQEVVRSRTIQVHRGRDQVSWEVLHYNLQHLITRFASLFACQLCTRPE